MSPKHAVLCTFSRYMGDLGPLVFLLQMRMFREGQGTISKKGNKQGLSYLLCAKHSTGSSTDYYT